MSSRLDQSDAEGSDCFALTAETIIDEAVKLHYIGGTYANTRPTEFLCLVLKLLQIQPEKEIVMEYLRAEEFKCALVYPAARLISQIPASPSAILHPPHVPSDRHLRHPRAAAQRLPQAALSSHGCVRHAVWR